MSLYNRASVYTFSLKAGYRLRLGNNLRRRRSTRCSILCIPDPSRLLKRIRKEMSSSLPSWLGRKRKIIIIYYCPTTHSVGESWRKCSRKSFANKQPNIAQGGYASTPLYIATPFDIALFPILIMSRIRQYLTRSWQNHSVFPMSPKVSNDGFKNLEKNSFDFLPDL